MVHFQAAGTSEGVRSFLEALVELAKNPEEVPVPRVSGVRLQSVPHKIQITIPAKLLDCRLQGAVAKMLLHITYFDNTGNIRLQCAGSLESRMFSTLQKLELVYLKYISSSEAVMEAPPDGTAFATSTFRRPAFSETLLESPGDEATAPESEATQSTHVPDDEAFQQAVLRIATVGNQELLEYPTWRIKFLQYLRTEFAFEPVESAGWSLS